MSSPLTTKQSCDENDQLLQGTARVIYSWGLEKPIDGVPAQHAATNRGTRSVNLLQVAVDDSDFTVPGETLVDVDFTFLDTTIPGGKDTRYWWKTFTWPTSNKVHVVEFEPIIPEVETANVHHMLLYMCGHEFSEFEKMFEGENSNDMIPDSLRACNFVEPLAGWAG